MKNKARVGQWVLVTIFILIALSELGLAVLNIYTERFRGSQVGRVILTGWLLWKIWDGFAWARWLIAGLFLVTAIYAVSVAIFTDFEDRTEAVWVIGGAGATFLLFAIGLATPWVGAFQAVRRPHRPDPTSWSELQKERPWTR